MSGGQQVACEFGGKLFEGYAVSPQGLGPHPAVLIIHGGNGLHHIVPRAAERLAEAGYLAVAADMIGPGKHDGPMAEVRKAFGDFGRDPLRARDLTGAWLEVVKRLPGVAPDQIAAIGYCFGGHCVLELARSAADLRAVVSFHGILTTSAPAKPGSVRAEIAIYSGARDPYVPPEQVERLRRELARADASFSITTFSHALHAFTDPSADMLGEPELGYHEVADKVSWNGMMALLELKLGKP